MKLIQKTLLSASAVLLLAACGNGAVEEPSDNQPGEVETTESKTDQDTSSATDTNTNDEEQNDTQAQGIQGIEFDVSLDDALGILSDTFGDVDIEQVHFDRTDNLYVYDIDAHDGSTEYELVINAETGDIVDQKQEAGDDADDVINTANIITPNEAMDIVMQEVSDGAYIEEWELDSDDGRIVYEIEVENDNEFKVDAETGDIIERD